MIVILFSGKELWLPDLPNNLDLFSILYDLHFIDLHNKKTDTYSKKVKKIYIEDIPLSLTLATIEIKNLIKNPTERLKVTFPYKLFSSEYLEIIYHPNPSLYISGNFFPTPMGYLEIIAYDTNKKEVYRAYILRESILLRLLYSLYQSTSKNQ